MMIPKNPRRNAGSIATGALLCLCVMSLPISTAAIATVPILGFGTAIIGFVNSSSGILMASDSRFSLSQRGKKERESLTMCKIAKLGTSLFFAAAGTLTFDPIPIIQQSIRETNGIWKALELAESRIQAAMEKGLADVKRYNPQSYRKSILHAVDLIIFGAQLGSVFLYRRQFVIDARTDKISVQVNRENCPSKSCPPGEYSVVSFGQRSALDRYERDNPKPSSGSINEWANWTKAAIEAQTKETPQTVGGPVNILFLKPSGEYSWLEGKDRCSV